tara:strand:+ start:120608 stop:120769 length:162 start_codon:yes stop_codon:yes gene_type:complete
LLYIIEAESRLLRRVQAALRAPRLIEVNLSQSQVWWKRWAVVNGRAPDDQQIA